MGRPVGTTANPDWHQATDPVDLVPETRDPAGAGERMLRLCSLPRITQGDAAGEKFGEVMLPWQRALIRYIYGEVDDTGARRVRQAFVKIGKGNGKSAFAAMLALAHLMDHAIRGRGIRGLIMVLAPNTATADIVFQHVLEAIRADPDLETQFKTYIAKRQITHVESGIHIEIAPARLDATVGRRPLMLIVDEVHLCAVEVRQFSQVLDQARKGGRNWGASYLELMITTAPPETATGTYAEALHYARRVRDGEVADESFLPVLFEYPVLERPDLDVEDPETWWRGCPSAVPGGPLPHEELIDEYAGAKRTGVARNIATFLSQRLGVEPNISRVGDRTPLQEAWCTLPAPADPAHPPQAIAIDPGGSNDPGVICYVWQEDGGAVGLRARQFLTRDGYDRAGDALRAIYDQAATAGELLLCETAGELDDRMMTEIVAYTNKLGDAACLGGDLWGRAGFVPRLREMAGFGGQDFVPVSQGWKLLRAHASADALASDGLLRPVRTPLLTYNVDNLVIEDGPRGRQFAKRDAAMAGAGQLKIDGAMAMLSALELLLEHASAPFDVATMIG